MKAAAAWAFFKEAREAREQRFEFALVYSSGYWPDLTANGYG